MRILKGVKLIYEQFHNIKYNKDIMRYAVQLSVKYMTDHFLPDKAIKLIDEAIAFRELHLQRRTVQIVDKALIERTVKKMCKLSDDMFNSVRQHNDRLANLQDKIENQVFGQQMVQRILEKKLNILKERLKTKNVEFTMSNEAQEYLLNKGFSQKYGARRWIASFDNR